MIEKMLQESSKYPGGKKKETKHDMKENTLEIKSRVKDSCRN